MAMFDDRALTNPDFDEEAYLRYALHAANYEAEQARLAACTKTVRDEMHTILTENAEDMLCQVTAACHAQRDVTVVQRATTSLAHSISRLRHTIHEPHHFISAEIAKLQNTNAALSKLRGVQKFLSLFSRLQSSAQSDDLPRTARTLRELEALLHSNDLSGIEVIDARRDALERAAVALRARAADLLRRGGDKDDDGATVAALQCFVALGSLPRVLASLMTEQKRDVMKVLMRELDVQGIADEAAGAAAASPNVSAAAAANAAAASSSPLAPASAAFTVAGFSPGARDVFFRHLQSALAGTTRHTRIVVAVWRALVRRTDPVTHAPLLAAVENPTAVLGDYWQLVAEKLRERLQAAQKRPQLLAAMTGDVLQYYSQIRGFLADTRELFEILNGLMEREQRRGDTLLVSDMNNNNGFSNDNTNSGADAMRDTWLQQVTHDVSERFAAQLLDRHRERLHHVLSKLPSITPARGSGGGPVSISVDLQHPRVPAAAQALDTRAYTAVAAQDVSMYQHDSAALAAVLDCVVQCLRSFAQEMADAVAKWPLPPLPSVAGDTTAAQLLHVCASNACTELSADVGALLAALADDVDVMESTGHVTSTRTHANTTATSFAHAHAAAGDGRDGAARDAVLERRQRMQEIAATLREMSEETVRPFFRSATILFLDSVSMCVDGTAGPGVAQLQSQVRHFLSRFFYLFDPTTPLLEQLTRGLTNGLLARLMAAIAVTYPLTQTAQQHAVVCLTQVTRVVLSLSAAQSHGTVARSTMALKGQTHQLAAWYGLSCDGAEWPTAEWHALLATLHPVLARLLLLQRLVPTGAKRTLPFEVMGITRESFILKVGAVIGEHMCPLSDAGTVEEKNGDTDLELGCDSDALSIARKQFSEVVKAVDTCFADALEGAKGNASLEPIAQWTEQLWNALQAPSSSCQ